MGRQRDRWDLPVSSRVRTEPFLHVWLGWGAAGTLVLGFFLGMVEGEAGWCARHPDDVGGNMFVSQSCAFILAEAGGFEIFMGRLVWWLLGTGLVLLVWAVALWVRQLFLPAPRPPHRPRR